jgi:putative copper resistance protein D
MFFITPNYVNGWIINYGQALLIKHLLFIPLLLFGFMNGYLMEKRLHQDPGFDPRKWLRAESIFALLIFVTTAFMGFQTPPHESDESSVPVPTSPLFQLFHPEIQSTASLSFTGSILGFVLAAVACLSLAAILMRYKKISSWNAIFYAIVFVMTGYLSVMFFVS